MQNERPNNNSARTCRECAKITTRLCAYLDGGLSAAERAAMSAHLADCAGCSAELARQKRAESALASAAFTAPPAGDLRDGFYRKLALQNASASPRKPNQWRLAIPALAAASLCAALWRPGLEVPIVSHEIAARAKPGRSPAIGSAQIAVSSVSRRVLPRVPIGHPSALQIAQALPEAQQEVVKADVKAPPEALPRESPPLPAQSHDAAERTWKLALAQPSDSASAAGDKIGVGADRDRGRAALYDAKSSVPDVRGLASAPGSVFRFNEAKAAMNAPLAYDANALEKDSQTARAGSHASRFFGDTRLPAQTFAYGLAQDALDLPPPVVKFGSLLAENADAAKAKIPAEDRVDFEVRDEERGFESRTYIAGRVEQRQDGETLTIEAEADNGS